MFCVHVPSLIRGGFDIGDISELTSNMQEIFLLGLLKTRGVHSEISTSVF